jgi:hypothetical protein
MTVYGETGRMRDGEKTPSLHLFIPSMPRIQAGGMD